MRSTRRTFLASSGSAVAAGLVAYRSDDVVFAKNDRPTFGLVGAGWQPETRRRGRGIAIGLQAARLADIKLICDVDSVALDYAGHHVGEDKAELVDDYRRVLDDAEIDAVLIATPDHWHAKIAIEAMLAGKDVYCEKPVAVTIQEGQWLRDVASRTGRVFQVGTQQRSEYDQRFLTAVAMVRQGRIGRVTDIRIGLGSGWEGGPFETAAAPKSLDWQRWLGPAPMTDYIPQRTHRTFRWWFEYAGGQICDWGAHHVDIAQWAIGMQDSGPSRVGGTGTLNQPLRDGMPTRSDTYNTPIDFSVTCEFPEQIKMRIDSSRNGITFTGDRGRFFVNRGTLEGVPVDALKDNPLPPEAITDLYGGQPGSHMQNFVDALASGGRPISDIDSHHRILTTCHLANLSLRLGRPIRWDPAEERILADEVASGLIGRTYRAGYEIPI